MAEIPQLPKKNKGGHTLTVVNQVNLDAKTPIPIQYNGNTFKYSFLGKKYLPFLDQKDNLAVLLLEARLTSPTQNSCINTIVESTIGQGLKVTNVENPNQDFIDWLGNVNNHQDTMDEILKEVVDGERSLGNHFIEVVKGQVGKVKFIKIYTHSLRYARLGEIDKKTGQPTNVILSKSFGQTKGYTNKSLPDDNVIIPLYDPKEKDVNKNWKNDGLEYRTMFHIKNKYSGIDHYGLPASIASIRQQVQEGNLAQYNIDNLENNMVLGGMLIFKSAMTQEEANANAKNIILSHTGKGKTGRVAVLSSEQGLEDVEFKTYETQKEGSFIELDKRIEEKIIGSNGWAKEFCYSDSASLGKGGSHLRSLWDLKETSLLKPLRKKIISKIVVPIAKIYAEHFAIKEVADYEFDMPSAMPFSFLGDLKPEDIMQVNEGRALAKLPKDDSKEGMYISELNQKTKDVQTQSTT